MEEAKFKLGDKATIGNPPFLYGDESISGISGDVVDFGGYLEFMKTYIIYLKTKEDAIIKVLESELLGYKSDLFPIY